MLFVLLFFCFLFAAPVRDTQAAGINVVTSARKVSTGKWIKNSAGYRYRYKSGAYAKNTWLNIGGHIYRFGAEGYRRTGSFVWNGSSYYANRSNGQLYIKRWITSNATTKYYYKADAVRAKNEWVKIGKSMYYFQKNGKLAMNQIITYKGEYYYVNRAGVRLTNTWLVKGGKRYYITGNGKFLRKSWMKLKEKFYYLGEDGAVVTNCWVGSYYVGANGARLTNCVKDGWYLDETGKKSYQVFTGRYIFVGDSRMVGMESSASSTDTLYIAKVGMGYNWLMETADETLRQQLKARPELKVVFGFGVNDFGNIERYVAYYRQLMKDFPETKFHFLSVNPVDEEKEAKYGYQVKNTVIESFNRRLYQAFRSRYIDSYAYLCSSGFSTVDGVHYTRATYRKLRSFILTKIR